MLEQVTKDELIVQNNIKPSEVFAPNGTDKILADLTKMVDDFKEDVTTSKGRKAIKSFNHKLARSKTFMLELGKKYTAGKREEITAINSERNKIVDGLQALQDKVIKPVKEFEDAEKARIEKAESDIQEIAGGGNQAMAEWDTLPLEAIKDRLSEIQAEEITEERFEEFLATASEAKEEAINNLEYAIGKREKHDSEQAELAKHREAEEKRKEDERKEELRLEGEKRAKEKAQEEADKKTEAERVAKEEAEERANKAESDKKEAGEKAEREKEEAAEQAEKDKKEASEKAEQDKQQAIDDERKRQEDEKREERKKEEARASDERIIKAIHNSALCDLEKIEGVTAELGKRILTRIANNGITNVFIKY